MKVNMKVAILKCNGGLEFRQSPIPSISSDEVLIRVLICGLCSSDINAWIHGLGQEYILGHEVVGIVEKTGSAVSGLSPGDRVTGIISQGYREYTVAKAANLLKVPDQLADQEAIVEPLVCLLSGIDRTITGHEDHVAVIGAGYMGLSLIKLLKLAGVSGITAIDIRPKLLEAAVYMGAAHGLLYEACQDSVYPIVFEVAGSNSALQLCGKLCAPFGTMVLIGYHPLKEEIEIVDWQEKSLVIVNSFESRNLFQLTYLYRALQLVVSGDFPAASLMTHEFSFDDLEPAFVFHIKKEDGYLKSFIRISKH
jgi:threonine dehydrogenase-like Zn-dependent dehydrogenase